MMLRVLVDECAGPSLARWLSERGHDAESVYDSSPGIPDTEVLAWAVREQRVLITADKDFGDLIYRDSLAHAGVILLRLDDERSQNKIEVVARLLSQIGDQLLDRFTVATETQARVRSPPPPRMTVALRQDSPRSVFIDLKSF